MFFKAKKIAIVRRNGFGDLLCCMPMVHYLKKFNDKCEITLFVDKRNAPLIPYLKQVDHWEIFPNISNKYLSVLKTAFKFRKQFDLMISAKTSPMKLMNLFLFLTGAKKRVAYVNDSWHSKLINHSRSYDKFQAAHQHQALKTLHLVENSMTAVDPELYPKIEIEESAIEKYRCSLKQIVDWKAASPIVYISASNNRATSTINAERYAYCLNQLSSVLHANSLAGFKVVIGCESKDRAKAQKIADLLLMPHIVYTAQSFDEFLVSLNQCSHVFVGDGGVAHMAAALQKKMLVLFGMTSIEQWAPLSNNAISLYHAENVNLIPHEHIHDALRKLIS